MAEQRYQAELAVIRDGRTVTETAAAAVGVSRQANHGGGAGARVAGPPQSALLVLHVVP